MGIWFRKRNGFAHRPRPERVVCDHQPTHSHWVPRKELNKGLATCKLRGDDQFHPSPDLEEAQNLREEAKLLFGTVRDAALKKARQLEAAAHMDDWLNSPGLQPPRDDNVTPI